MRECIDVRGRGNEWYLIAWIPDGEKGARSVMLVGGVGAWWMGGGKIVRNVRTR